MLKIIYVLLKVFNKYIRNVFVTKPISFYSRGVIVIFCQSIACLFLIPSFLCSVWQRPHFLSSGYPQVTRKFQPVGSTNGRPYCGKREKSTSASGGISKASSSLLWSCPSWEVDHGSSFLWVASAPGIWQCCLLPVPSPGGSSDLLLLLNSTSSTLHCLDSQVFSLSVTQMFQVSLFDIFRVACSLSRQRYSILPETVLAF